jgi:hypothetical protein
MVTQLYLKEILITSNTRVDKLTTIDFMYRKTLNAWIFLYCMWISEMYCEPSIGIAIAMKIVEK